MQTTLLGLAVAIILALVTALVGPLLVDWSRYRPNFEAEASRIAGVPVRVHGAIDVRLLPSPSLVVRDVEAGEARELKARALSVEFGLGPLLRGEWRATDLRLDAPQLRLGLDPAGRLAALAPGFDPDQLSIDRFVIDNGRLVLADAASGASLALDKLSFHGDLRSLAGPFKGDGAFVAAGELFGFRLAGGRRGGEGMRLRLSLDAAERPLAVETDGMLAFEQGMPRYDGALTLARPVGTALASGRTVVSDPLRLTGRLKATPQEALLEQVEVQHGPEDRVTRLTGTASLKFGSRPEFQGVLSARQLDLDRAAGAPEGARRPPVAALQAFLASVVAGVRLPVPVKLGIDVDALTIGGAALQAVRGDLQSDGDAWTIDSFEFRAPGLTQVRLGGRFKVAGTGVEFTGPASVDSSDPRALVAWLEGRPEGKREPLGALRARGDVTLGSERIAVDRLKAEIDRKALDGRLAYMFATGDRRARLEAALSAAEIDLDAALAFVTGALKGSTFERPGEIALALNIGKATYAGIEANRAEANLRMDASGLQIERLNVSDFRGASLSATGLIDTSSASPRGAVSVVIDAQKLDGVIAVAARWAPQTAEAIQRYASRLGSAKVNARLEVEPAKDKTAAVKLAVEGRLGVVRVNLTATGTGDPGTFAPATLRLGGTVEADEGAVLAALVGVDRYVAVDMRPAALSLALDGPPNGEMRVDARFAAGGLWASGAGTMQLGKDGPSAKLDLSVSASEARLEGARPVPVALSTRFALTAGRDVRLDDLSGRIAGSAVAGRLALLLGDPIQAEGRIAAQGVDAAAVIAAAIGAPARAAGKSALWPTEPFGRAALAEKIAGRIELDLAQASLSPALLARELRGVARFDRTGIAFEDVEGSLADGRFSASAEFRNAPAGIFARGQFSLDKADMAALVPPGGKYPVAGRLSLKAEAEGTGLSPAALVGALQGSGTLTVETVSVAGLDPRAIGAAIDAAERGVPLERVPAVVPAALEKGRLAVAGATSSLAIANGRVKLGDFAAPAAEGTDITVAASLDLIEDAVDARFTLSGPAREDTFAGRRPDLSVTLKGPWSAPRRGVDTAALMNWVTLRTVEREARRLETAEREAKLVQEATRRARERAEQERAERERIERERADAERAERERKEASASAPVERAPELPPPVDIRPVPVKPQPRAAKPSAQAQAAPPAPAPPPQGQPVPPPPRTPLQILQGWFSN